MVVFKNKFLKIFITIFVLLGVCFYIVSSSKSKVIIVGPNFVQQAYFEEELNLITKNTGIKIEYFAVNDVEYYLSYGDNKADIVLLSDSESLKEFGNTGKLIDISNLIEMESYLLENQYLLSQVSSNDGKEIYGYWFRMFNNSMIWFNNKKNSEISSKEFKNFDEILAFTSSYASETVNPWCLSIHSGENQNLLEYEIGESSGWIVSNWLENLILSEHGQQFYDLYSDNEISFSNNKVILSMLDIKKLTEHDNFVYGNKEYILKNTVSQSAVNLMDENNPCFLSWIGFDFLRYISFEDYNFENINYKKFPSEINPEMVVGFGDIFGLLNNNSNSKIVFQNLINENFGKIWASKEDTLFVSANSNFDENIYKNDLLKSMFLDVKYSILNNQFRIDASMLMKNGVGKKIIWTSLREFIYVNSESVLDITEEIDRRIKNELGS